MKEEISPYFKFFQKFEAQEKKKISRDTFSEVNRGRLREFSVFRGWR